MNSFRSKINKHLWKLPVLAADPRYVIPLQGPSVQFLWPMHHEVSTTLPELMQVFQQHASSKCPAQILGYKITGWRLPQKPQRRRPRQLKAVPVTRVGPNEIRRKPNKPFCVSLSTLVTPWIPKVVSVPAQSHIRARLFVTPWTLVLQCRLFMGFSSQDYWSRLLFPPPGDLHDPGIQPHLLHLLHWQADSLLLRHWGSRLKMRPHQFLAYLIA